MEGILIWLVDDVSNNTDGNVRMPLEHNLKKAITKFCRDSKEKKSKGIKAQYYYKVDGCKTINATDAGCICWHNEGTGPFKGERYNQSGAANAGRSWRLGQANG